jgi:hypothetical protein
MIITIAATPGLTIISQSDPDFETAIAIMMVIKNQYGSIAIRF